MHFLDELLEEVDLKEEQQTEAYYDLLLLSVKKFTSQIENNFNEAEKECTLIKNFVLNKNQQIQEKIRFIELKLQAFIKEKHEKTIDLPNGTLKMHKKPDKVEIEDLDLFLKNAKPEMLTVIPEQVKPDMNKIKAHIKVKPVPPGVRVIEGKEEFSYKLKGGEEDGRTQEAGAGTEQNNVLRAVV